MKKDDIIIERIIIHILDATTGSLVLSNGDLDCGSGLQDFFKAHIERITCNNDLKTGVLIENSTVYTALCSEDSEKLDFIAFSQLIATNLFTCMQKNQEIPEADLAVIRIRYNSEKFMACLKLNYKKSYTHMTGDVITGNVNHIILQKSLFPTQSQKIAEAAIINMDTFEIQILEKKYVINGKRSFYFAEQVFQCITSLSESAKLDVVFKTIKRIDKKDYGEDAVREMEINNFYFEELVESNVIEISSIEKKVFQHNEDRQKEFREKIKLYSFDTDIINPGVKAAKRFDNMELVTDTGIHITVPTELYSDKECIEFSSQADGSMIITIRSIDNLTLIDRK